MSIKPVVGVVDGKVVVLGKARGSKASRSMVFEEIEKAGGIDFTRPVWVAYSGLSDKIGRKYIADSLAIAADEGIIESPDAVELPLTLVGAVIGTHVGPDGVAFAFGASGYSRSPRQSSLCGAVRRTVPVAAQLAQSEHPALPLRSTIAETEEASRRRLLDL